MNYSKNNPSLSKLEGYGYTLDDVLAKYKRFKEARQPHLERWKRIDLYESGKIWNTVKKKFPKHQLLVDTNYLDYIRNAKTNAIYTGEYFADIQPTHQVFAEAARQLNKYNQHVYKKADVAFQFALAGYEASTKGMAGVAFGWDSKKISTYTGGRQHTGEMTARYVPTGNLLLDPNTIKYQEGSALFIPDTMSLAELASKYPDEMKSYFNWKKADSDTEDKDVMPTSQDQEDMGKPLTTQPQPIPQDKAVSFIKGWYKYYNNGKTRLDEIVIIDGEFILYCNKGIQPNYFPVEILYSALPEKDPYASSPAYKVMTNCLTINILKSIRATHAYMSQRRPYVLRQGSGVNPRKLARDMHSPNKVILATGDINNVLAALEVPDLPGDMAQQIEDLTDDVLLVTGVDLRYTGRDTGSAQTTGGVTQIMERTSVITDNTQVMLLERAVKGVTKLIVDLHVEHADKREILVRSKNEKLAQPIVIDFPAIKKGVTAEGIHDSEHPENNIDALFEYDLEATPLLPKNRARHAEAANIMMEKQMQYQMNPPLITPEEWLVAQMDFPQRDAMLDRMRIDKLNSDAEEIAGDVMNFSNLVQQGFNPDEAVEQLANERQLRRDSGKTGNVVGQQTFAPQQNPQNL